MQKFVIFLSCQVFIILSCQVFILCFYQVGEILVPVTAHAAFDKAAELLGMRIRWEVQYHQDLDQEKGQLWF